MNPVKSPWGLLPSRALGLFCLLTLAGAEVRADPIVELQGYLDSLQTLHAEFVQTSQDPNTREEQHSDGKVILQKPGKFRWDYQTPYEQVIVSDGERVWHYDVDLEQVTVQPLADTMGSTPLGLLMGSEAISLGFKVSVLPATGGEIWFELRRLDQGCQFQVLRLALSEGEISALELDDALGQTTKLRFTAVQRNRPVEPELLRFTPPPGVDVIGEG